MRDEILRELAEQYETPLYVFDTQKLRERVRRIREIFGPQIPLTYSIKANPFLIPAMLEEGLSLEVCSPGELTICKSLGVPGERIVYSGVSRTLPDIRDAADAGAGIYTAESIRQAELLQEAASEEGRVFPVLLRKSAKSQFGMSEEDLLYLIREREKFPNLRIEGIHYFVGTQRKNKGFERQRKELESLRTLFEKVRDEYGFILEKLEYGPGLPVPLFEGDDFSDTLAPAESIAPFLREAASWCHISVEMGRFFATECGSYITRIMDLKSDEDRHYCITDGGINHVSYLGQIMGMKKPVLRHLKTGSILRQEGAAEYTVCGSLCTVNDDLIRSCELDGPAIGDLLVFENIGAYSVTEGIYLFLSRTLPGIVLYNSDSDIQPARGHIGTSPLNTIGGRYGAADKSSPAL